MSASYAPVLIFLVIAGAFGLLMLALGFAFGRGRKSTPKLAPYECGFEAFEDTRMRFDVRYYLVAILFIIFDLEIAFLVPWAVALDRIGWKVLDAKRVATGMKPVAEDRPDKFSTFLSRQPEHVEIAGAMGLGEFDEKKIDFRKIRLA